MRLNGDAMPFVTDQGNYILDAQFGLINDPASLAQTLINRVGIVEHGLFVGIADEVIVGRDDGIEILSPN